MDWSPKAGCTVAVKMFFEHMGLLDKANQYSNHVHDYRQHVFYEHNTVSLDDLLNPDYFSFKIVRNPYARVVSSYLHIMKHIHIPRIPRLGILRIKAEIMGQLNLYNADISFSQFIDYLLKIDIINCNNHMAQQYRLYEDGIEWNKICKLENIVMDISEVNRLAGAGFRIKGRRSHHHIKKNDQLMEYVYDKPWSTIKNQIPRYSFFYTPDLADKVFDLFHEDLNAYQYSIDDFLISY
ncbi:MAG: sulfotransferase family protein [Bacteroidales bacterium]|nr:sulfotransferase family protein [Bacteroidales bacterium]MCF8377796.1 sulfotransferase family protein [Bacteroidales bacterium]